MAGGRTYNEREIGALMKRATEIHEASEGAPHRHLSLAEIEQLATELGVPAEALLAAALELEHGRSPSRKKNLLGGPFVTDEMRVVNGEVSDSYWEDVVLDLRQATGRTGRISETGQAREWSYHMGEGDDGVNFTKTKVTVRPKDGQTSIHIRKQYGGLALWYPAALIPLVSLMLAVTNAFPGPEVGFPSLAAVMALMIVVRTLIASASDRKKDSIRKLADRLQASAAMDSGAASTSGASASGVSRADVAAGAAAGLEATPAGGQTSTHAAKRDIEVSDLFEPDDAPSSDGSAQPQRIRE